MLQTTRWKLFCCVCATVIVGGATAQACGGDNNNNGDSGPDATSSDAATGDSPTDSNQNGDVAVDAACPTYSGSVPLCQASVAHCNACGVGNATACTLANFTAQCEAIATVYSQAFAAAYTACDAVCDQDAATACEKNAVADASFSTAQAQAANDFCAVCSDSGTCVPTFEKDIVAYSDTVVSAFDSKCSPDASAKCLTYGLCVSAVVAKALETGPCADAGAD